jgi:hypothetical protein
MASGAQDLDAFVRESLLRGIPREQVSQALRDAGWPQEQVDSALAAYASVAFPIPVPRPRPSLGAREAFLYLLQFTTLYLSAFNVGRLLYEFINRRFPDRAIDAAYTVYPFHEMRWEVSILIIAFPVFLFLARYIGAEVARDPAKRLSPVRRWLTYLTLFIAADFLIGDAATLVFNLLGGELTIRFVLKVLVVAAIAGTAFWYYLSDLRHDEHAP